MNIKNAFHCTTASEINLFFVGSYIFSGTFNKQSRFYKHKNGLKLMNVVFSGHITSYFL